MQFEKEFSLHPDLPYWLIALMAVGMVLVSFYSYSKTHREISGGQKLLLTGLRIFAWLLIILCLLRPSLTNVEYLREKGWVLILQDNSRSMLIKDMPGEMARARSLKLAISENRELFQQIEEQYPRHVMNLLFGRETRPGLEHEPDWTDKVTDLGNALEKAGRLSRGKKIAGILLFSDGANNHGPEPVQKAMGLHDLAAPLYVFGTGRQQSDSIKDARVVDVITPRRVFSGNSFPVDAELHFLGLDGETVDVVFKFDDNEVERKKVQVKTNQDVSQIRFMHREIRPGSHYVSVEIQPVSGEISDRNNSQGTYVEVISGGLNVLYLEGQFRHEFTFIKRSLSESPNVILAAPFPFQISRTDRMQRFLQANDLSQYHAIIIGDLPASVFNEETLEFMKRLVERRGIGLAMIGGYKNLGAGGYGQTPLADILPIELADNQGQEDRVTRVIPTDAGLNHFLMSLESDPAKNSATWNSMPRLAGYSVAGQPKPAASVLAVSESQYPLIVVQDSGKGRTAAILADTTYRWRMGHPSEMEVRHKKFWRQVVLWLASRDKLGEKNLLLSLDKFQYRLGEETRIFAEVTDEKGNPVENAQVKVTVTHETEKKVSELSVSYKVDHYESRYSATQDGVYIVKAEAMIDGEKVGERETRFKLSIPDREFDSPQADLKLLMNIAEASGGSFHKLEELSSVLEEIRDKKLATEIRRERHQYIWDNYWIFSLFVLTLMLEWIFRRNQGLV
ncbi:MAG: glutamine amidotransferase [Planctomycetota bacterium]|nr:glutamine amidotransferase [Planctomycetota bacterium]